MTHTAESSSVDARRHWMSVLARASLEALENAWQDLPERPAYVFLRRPEIGLAMVRGRAGGTGERFNLGEMTMTRCAVQLARGIVGHGYVAGRAPRKAELAAVLDALMQDRAGRAAIEAKVIAPLAAAERTRRDAAARKAAATRVEFFTMVRGD